MGIAIVVNGPSSVGKSTLVSGLQGRSAVPLLRFGVDELYRMVPAGWAGGEPDARHGERGFRYLPDPAHGPGARRIVNGPDAMAMLRAHHAGVLGMLRAGHHVVVDGQAYEPSLDAEFRRALSGAAGCGVESSVVELRASGETLADRQARHDHPAGLALGNAARAGAFTAPDLLLDTSGLSADTVLDRVWDRLVSRHPVLRPA
ncbi:phosphotransferase-like protein [Pseudonocardia sp. HH130630-07]|uniref:phosphotransferase-like protein n=1 Tax=Pseudonocardia sp. HH130630-07 TaxID=1690815 RepID=UPI000839CC69|nr:AAA family ATPase [Pseudonocardia sp. HH130630-07]